MSRGKIRIGLTAAEAAHVYRDMLDVAKIHGRRNVSRETHDSIMERLSTFLEVAYGVPYQSQGNPRPAAPDGLGED